MNESLFWSKADIKGNEDCWPWMGYLNRDGYGNFSIDGKKRKNAHRVAYELVNGNIPAGMLICHTCDNPACINPRHLYLGTVSDNARDRSERGRFRTHVLTKEDINFIKSSSLSCKKLAHRFGVSGRAIARYK